MSEKVDELKDALTETVTYIKEEFNKIDITNMEEILHAIMLTSDLIKLVEMCISIMSKEEMKEFLGCARCEKRHSCSSYLENEDEDEKTLTFPMNVN